MAPRKKGPCHCHTCKRRGRPSAIKYFIKDIPRLRGRWPCNKEHGNIIRKYFQQYNHPSSTRSRRHSRYKEHGNILFWKHSKNRMELIHLKLMKQLKEVTYKSWIFSSATYDSGTSNRRLLPIQHGRLQSQKIAYFVILQTHVYSCQVPRTGYRDDKPYYNDLYFH
jgi:hypothetical protein